MSDLLTVEELAQLRRVVARAFSGPWQWLHRNGTPMLVRHIDGHDSQRILTPRLVYDDDGNPKATIEASLDDMALIAAAGACMSRLLVERDAMTKVVNAARLLRRAENRRNAIDYGLIEGELAAAEKKFLEAERNFRMEVDRYSRERKATKAEAKKP